MSFLDENHIKKIKEIETVWHNLVQLSKLAEQFGIDDIFLDNGAKILQQLIYLNFANLPGREGNDAKDENGVEWEMKSINVSTSASGFSTNHHTNYVILKKYRQVPWSFAIYEGIELKEIYVMSPQSLEPMFSKWQQKLDNGRSHLNNPKIPVSFVKRYGIRVFPINYNNPVNPASFYGQATQQIEYSNIFNIFNIAEDREEF